jgi:putative tryptophan/tyrosine transport system substrate-binding protein
VKRREFIAGLAGAAAWPLAARAQPAPKLQTIGFLGAATASVAQPWLDAPVQGLRELNWVEGRNIVMEVRWAEGRRERAAEIAAEFVQRKSTSLSPGQSGQLSLPSRQPPSSR